MQDKGNRTAIAVPIRQLEPKRDNARDFQAPAGSAPVSLAQAKIVQVLPAFNCFISPDTDIQVLFTSPARTLAAQCYPQRLSLTSEITVSAVAWDAGPDRLLLICPGI